MQLEALCVSLWLARFVRFLIFQFQLFFYFSKSYSTNFFRADFCCFRSMWLDFICNEKKFCIQIPPLNMTVQIPSLDGELIADTTGTPTTFPKTFKCSSSGTLAQRLSSTLAMLQLCKWHSICVLLKNRWNINFHSVCNDGVDTLRTFAGQFILRIPEAFARFWTQLELQRQIMSCLTAQSNFFSSTKTRVYFSINFAQIHFSLPQKIYKNLRFNFFLAFSTNFFSPYTRLRKPHICKWLII